MRINSILGVKMPVNAQGVRGIDMVSTEALENFGYI